MGQGLVDEVLRDVETSRLDLPHKELFRYLGKVAQNSTLVVATDIEHLKQVGWTEEAIYDALTVASLFQFYNTWINASGVQNMSSVDYVHSGTRLRTMGYCMDFSLKTMLQAGWGALRRLVPGRRPASKVRPQENMTVDSSSARP